MEQPNTPPLSVPRRRADGVKMVSDSFLCDITGQRLHSSVARRRRRLAGAPRRAGEEGGAGGGGVREVRGCLPHLSSACVFCCCGGGDMAVSAGAGRLSRWTAAAATARRSRPPAPTACARRACASPLEGAVSRQPASCAQSRCVEGNGMVVYFISAYFKWKCA